MSPTVIAKMTATLVLVFGLGTSGFSQGPADDEVGIKDVDRMGRGCTGEDVEVILDRSQPEGPIDTVRIKNPLVKMANRGRHLCHTTINFINPEGFSYSVAEVKTQGYMVIQSGVKGSIENEVSIQGTSKKAKTKRVQKGYWEGQFTMDKEKPEAIWTMCEKVTPIGIKQVFRLTGRNKDGLKSVISGSKDGTGAVTTEYRVVWRACDNS